MCLEGLDLKVRQEKKAQKENPDFKVSQEQSVLEVIQEQWAHLVLEDYPAIKDYL